MAKGPSSKVAGRKAKAKASSTPSRRITVASRAVQKVREHCKHLPDHACFVSTHNGKTLLEQVEADIKAKDGGDQSIVFGKLYYEQLTQRYAATDSVLGHVATPC